MDTVSNSMQMMRAVEETLSRACLVIAKLL